MATKAMLARESSLTSTAVICTNDERTRKQRAADVLDILASRGISIRISQQPGMLRLRGHLTKQLTEQLRAEILDVKPELLARLHAGALAAPLSVQLDHFGWSKERIKEVVIREGETAISVEFDAVTIVRETDWGGLRKVYRCRR
jgi:hypothetical protein